MRSKYAYGILSFSASWRRANGVMPYRCHPGGLLDLECALAILRRAVMRVRRLARC